MNDAETRVLARTAAVLLAASAVRFGWEARPRPPLPPPATDELPGLLAESGRLLADAEARARPLAPGETVDPNRATEAELDRLPGLGPAAARAIVAAREEGGPFTAPDDLLRVRGIGAATLDRIRPHLALGPSPRGAAEPRPVGRAPARAPAGAPVDLNAATAAELERLPGVGPSLAARIVAERTRRGGFGAVDDLLAVSGIGPATLERLRPLVRAGARRRARPRQSSVRGRSWARRSYGLTKGAPKA